MVTEAAVDTNTMDVDMEGDMGYGDAAPTTADMGYEDAAPTTADMGYEDAAPTIRSRGSMSAGQATERRASIKAIMADGTISPFTKRKSIQHLMDGRRGSMDGRRGSINGAVMPVGSIGHSSGPNPPDISDSMEGYGYGQAASSPLGSNRNNVHGNFICNDQTKWAETSRPVCTHYDRKCTLISPCCGVAFGCRICHDDCVDLPPKINNGGRKYHRSASLPSSFTSMEAKVNAPPEETHHNIDRFAVREVICRECFTRQSSDTYVPKRAALATPHLCIFPSYTHSDTHSLSLYSQQRQLY